MGSPLEREARGWEAYCSEKLEDGRPLSFGPLSLSKVWEQGRRKGQIGYKLTPKISKVAHSNDQEPGEKSIRALEKSPGAMEIFPRQSNPKVFQRILWKLTAAGKIAWGPGNLPAAVKS